MGSTNTRNALLAGWLIGLALLPGCRKQIDQRCQVSSDCAQGLVCNLTGDTVSMGGICEPPQDLTAVPDQAQVQDLSSGDQSVPTDGGNRDGGG